MATISFKDKTEGEAAPPVEAEILPSEGGVEPGKPEPDGTVATRPEQPLANAPASSANFVGDWDADDVRLSRVNLVHKTSKDELIEQFGIGGFCLDKEVGLSDGKTPIIITATRVKKDFVQKVPFGADFDAKQFNTAEEVRKAGMSFNYGDYTAKVDSRYVQRRAHIEIVLSLPEAAKDDDVAQSLFPYEFDGGFYTRAILTVSSSAYTSVAKELATLANKNKIMRQGLQYGKLELTSKTVPHATHPWKIPVIKFAGANTPEFVQFLNGLIGFKS